MAYSRIFVALNQGCSDYAKDIRGCGGRGILDIRNGRARLLMQVQGLKSDEDYRVCLLGEESCFEVPKSLIVNSAGRGELKCELDSADDIPKVKAMAVLARDKAPLIGFVGEQYNWQRCLMAKPESKESTADTVIAVEVKKECSETKPDKAGCTAQKDADSTDNEALKSIITGLEAAVGELSRGKSEESVKPFGEDGISWKKATLKELATIKPLWKYCSNPFVIQGCRQYKHILLGKSEDGFSLAVPCSYEPEYRLEAQMQGFSDFKPIEGRELKRGELCYCELKCRKGNFK
jgi:hypothetical protein